MAYFATPYDDIIDTKECEDCGCDSDECESETEEIKTCDSCDCGNDTCQPKMEIWRLSKYLLKNELVVCEGSAVDNAIRLLKLYTNKVK